MNLTEEIQRDKSRDSSARGITYILVEQSSKEENGSRYNGRGLGLKGSAACQRSPVGSEEVSRAPKGLQRVRRHIEGFKETLRGSKRHQGVRRDIKRVQRMSGTSREVSRASKGCPMTITPPSRSWRLDTMGMPGGRMVCR